MLPTVGFCRSSGWEWRIDKMAEGRSDRRERKSEGARGYTKGVR
jgi:hypothetical protein